MHIEICVICLQLCCYPMFWNVNSQRTCFGSQNRFTQNRPTKELNLTHLFSTQLHGVFPKIAGSTAECVNNMPVLSNADPSIITWRRRKTPKTCVLKHSIFKTPWCRMAESLNREDVGCPGCNALCGLWAFLGAHGLFFAFGRFFPHFLFRAQKNKRIGTSAPFFVVSHI